MTATPWFSQVEPAQTVADPDAFINGATKLVVEGFSRPATEVGKEAARNTNWTVLGLAGIGVFGGLAAWRVWLRRTVRGVNAGRKVQRGAG